MVHQKMKKVTTYQENPQIINVILHAQLEKQHTIIMMGIIFALIHNVKMEKFINMKHIIQRHVINLVKILKILVINMKKIILVIKKKISQYLEKINSFMKVHQELSNTQKIIKIV